MSMNLAIKTENLGRIYKIRDGKKSEPRELVALQDVNVEVQPGKLFGLLGSNGAGKTTLIKWAERQARERGLIDMVTNY